jgi:deoxyribose-phosphate aldolase
MDTIPLFDEFLQDFAVLPAYDPKRFTQLSGEDDVLMRIFSCIDLTSLNTSDSSEDIELFCSKVVGFPEAFPDFPNVAAICVYPVFASILFSRLKELPVQRAVVGGGFPSAQTFLDNKVAECSKAVFFGANEIDIVLSVGEFLEGNYELVGDEISSINAAIGSAHLKVILETGALESPENIWKASLLAMQAGADFIKTSTGKQTPAASPEAAWVMTHAIKAFASRRKKVVGFKPAGGIVSVEDALLYWHIVAEVLGEEWLQSERFRIGASRLANNLLTALSGRTQKYF